MGRGGKTKGGQTQRRVRNKERERERERREGERKHKERYTFDFVCCSVGSVGIVGLCWLWVALRVWGSISLNDLSTEATEEKRVVGRDQSVLSLTRFEKCEWRFNERNFFCFLISPRAYISPRVRRRARIHLPQVLSSLLVCELKDEWGEIYSCQVTPTKATQTQTRPTQTNPIHTNQTKPQQQKETVSFSLSLCFARASVFALPLFSPGRGCSFLEGDLEDILGYVGMELGYGVRGLLLKIWVDICPPSKKVASPSRPPPPFRK